MKKTLALALALSMALSCAACGSGSSSGSSPSGSGSQTGGSTAPKTLSIGTASLGGNFFTMGAAMASVMMDETGITVTAQATGGSAYNVTAVSEGEVNLGMAQASTIASGVAGIDQFEGAATTNICTLFNYNATPNHILVNKSLNITDITGLKGAKIECIAPGDGVETATKKMLPVLGISLDDVTLEYSGNRVQAASRLKTGQVDAIVDATGLGASWIADLYGTGDFVLLSLTDEQISAVCDAFEEMSEMVIPANTYDGQTEDVVTVGNWTTVFCRDDLDEDTAYALCKAVFDNKEELVKAHSFFGDLAPENIVDSCIAPLHPGAEKYYKEVGVLA